MADEREMGEKVWRQLIDYIDSSDLFFPQKIRQNITGEAEIIFESYMKLMIERKMLIKFEKKSISNRIALWLFKFRFRKRNRTAELLDIFIKGPAWKELKDKPLSELMAENMAKG